VLLKLGSDLGEPGPANGCHPLREGWVGRRPEAWASCVPEGVFQPTLTGVERLATRWEKGRMVEGSSVFMEQDSMAGVYE